MTSPCHIPDWETNCITSIKLAWMCSKYVKQSDFNLFDIANIIYSFNYLSSCCWILTVESMSFFMITSVSSRIVWCARLCDPKYDRQNKLYFLYLHINYATGNKWWEPGHCTPISFPTGLILWPWDNHTLYNINTSRITQYHTPLDCTEPW